MTTIIMVMLMTITNNLSSTIATNFQSSLTLFDSSSSLVSSAIYLGTNIKSMLTSIYQNMSISYYLNHNILPYIWVQISYYLYFNILQFILVWISYYLDTIWTYGWLQGVQYHSIWASIYLHISGYRYHKIWTSTY